MSHSRALLLVIFLAVMVWLWAPFLSNEQAAQDDKQDVLAQPDYIAMDLRQSMYNNEGQLTHTVNAIKVEMFQELGFSHFQSPTFTLYNQQQNWQLTANEATLYENNTLILEGDVVATNMDNTSMISHINAAHIRVDITNKKMLSEQPVVVSGPNLTITGQGLLADLKTDTIELNNHTRTIYYEK
ncbi:LPS export ABC transporter periplasmic protein LptC [Pseudoalteromonas xiamenensis]|uniref:LPS export ABC transporter periplasmic protein LptC n=1 Tax=Pseudoalteromonas xiamenensis TaxID=882626 RepID=UPI0035E50CD0